MRSKKRTRKKSEALAVSEVAPEIAQKRATALEKILKPSMERARQQLGDPSTDQRLKEAAQDMLDCAEALIHPPVKPVVFNSDAFNLISTNDPDAIIQPHELFSMRKATKVIQ